MAPVEFDAYQRLNFDLVQGHTLASLEPFDLENFTRLDSPRLVAVVDVAAYLAEGSPFTACQVLSATNGTIPQTSRIVFKDGATLSSDPNQALAQLLDDSFLSSLPAYSGNILVSCFHEEFRSAAQVATQTTDPLNANNTTSTSTLTPAFTIATGDATSAIVDWASLTHGNVNGCTTVSLRTPNATTFVLKADGAAPTNPYNVLSIYNGPNGGPGTYTIVLVEDSGGGGCSGQTAVLTGTTMTVSAVVPPAPPVGDGLTGNMMLASRGVGPDDVNITFDAATCLGNHAVVLWGNFGNFTAYQDAVATGCNAGGTGAANFTQPGSYWFNVVWVNATDSAGYPGTATSGPRTWTAAGFCGVTSDDASDNVCD